MNSMTGFGAATAPLGAIRLHIEISGVNRKQAEIVVSLPKAWTQLEQRIREYVASTISRGRANVSVSLQPSDVGGASSLALHEKKIAEFRYLLDRMTGLIGQPIQITTDSLIRLGLITDNAEPEIRAEEVWDIALADTLRRAAKQFSAMRATEGAHLRDELLARLGTLRAMRVEMKELAADIPLRYRDTLMQRLEEHGLTLGDDDDRLIKELAIFADKCDVSEEMARLESHFNQFEELCNSDQPVGRTLDFLCQEIFRELNTTGSKANSALLAQAVVKTKTELEKIREQVQNIE